MHLSRALDEIEESRLVPGREVLYQFSARGHELGQILLALELDHPHDGVGVYYRSRPLLLALGLSLEDAAAAPLAREGSFSGGRDIGVVFNRPGQCSATVLPACGGVGTQYTPAAGWAQALCYRRDTLADPSFAGGIAVAHGGDASVAANGFWSALTVATTLRLPLLFYIEDNGFGISVRSELQTPGGNIAANLASVRNLAILDGDGTDPAIAAELTARAVEWTRAGHGPVLLRLTVPRLCGHSAQDTQSYKPEAAVRIERQRDPLPRLERFLVPSIMSAEAWQALAAQARAEVDDAVERARARALPDAGTLKRYVFCETRDDGTPELQQQGGIAPEGARLLAPARSTVAAPVRINMLTAIRRTLDHELAVNPRLVLFGEDVGAKGGVHGATLGLAQKHGRERVFDTSLSEEGIIGRAVGMALAGLVPVAEIQFRKYADPAMEQLNDCGTMRWRTHNRFAAPIVVRMPGGFVSKSAYHGPSGVEADARSLAFGDPWHSQTNEVAFIHSIGWQVAMPSNAEDAVGLLRAAMRSNDPTIFFEHRAMLDAAWARRPYPGDDYILRFGAARRVRSGSEVTVVTWGAMVERCVEAADESRVEVEVLDLRTLAPWDRDSVLASVARTHRCLIVHEDNLTAGFGAEIAATLARDAFKELEAPVERLAMADIPSPHSPALLAVALPTVPRIVEAIRAVASA
jgi:2-oxoisovalerate dehydrogenase E1 component